MSSQFWRTVQQLATNASGSDIRFKKALMLINLAVLARITSKKRGVSTALYIQTTDIKAASANTHEAPDFQQYRQIVQAAGYGFDKDNVMCLAENAMRIVSGNEDGEEEMLIDGGFPSPGLGNQQGQLQGTGTDDEDE